jgi:hypothetical protein
VGGSREGSPNVISNQYDCNILSYTYEKIDHRSF